MTRADFTTCGRTFSRTEQIATTFMPSIKDPDHVESRFA